MLGDELNMFVPRFCQFQGLGTRKQELGVIMESVTTYKDLVLWQKAMELVELTYLLVRKLPKEETYALSD